MRSRLVNEVLQARENSTQCEDNPRMDSPLTHLDRVSRGQFPPDTRQWLADLVNGGLRGRFVLSLQPLGVFQRNAILRELWAMTPGDSDSSKARAILAAFSRKSNGRVAGRVLYARLRALEAAGVKMPGARQIRRVCHERSD